MLYSEYKTIYTDFLLEFNHRLELLTDRSDLIIEKIASEADIQAFILNLSELQSLFGKYPKDIHFEALQPKVESIYDKVIYDIKDLRNLSKAETIALETAIDELDYYVWDKLENHEYYESDTY
jgi:hypothetical protein